MFTRKGRSLSKWWMMHLCIQSIKGVFTNSVNPKLGVSSGSALFAMLSTFLVTVVNTKVSKEAKIMNRYNQVPHLTQDNTWESDKNAIKHSIQESQEASPFQAGDHTAAINRQESITNTKRK